MLVRGRGFGPRALRSGYRPTGGGSATPFQTLQAALGADLVGMWRVPFEDDATIDVSASRVSSLSSMVGGNAMLQATGANQPLFVTGISGLSGGACIHNDASGRYMEAALVVANDNRAGIYAVGRQVATNTNNMLWVNTIGSTTTNDSYLGMEYGASGYRHKACLSNASEPVISNGSPVYHQWHLLGIMPLASGMLARINGATGATNFATTLGMRDIATVRAGSTAALNGHYWKSIYIVQNMSIAYETAIMDYERAEGVLLEPLSSVVFAGQSNFNRCVLTDLSELPGYTYLKSTSPGQPIALWSKSGGGAMYTNLLTVLQRHVATGLRPVIAWSQGESDSDSEAEADAYLAALEQLNTDLETDLGQGSGYLYWVVIRFHDDILNNATYPWATEVDGHLAAFVAADTTNRTSVDPNLSGASTVDGVHWGPDGGPTSVMQRYVMDQVRARIVASGINP